MDDLIKRAEGRIAFCLGRGEIKTPGIMQELLHRIETQAAEIAALKPWALFYRDGKTIGEIANECGGTIYSYSPALTAPITRAILDATKEKQAEIARLKADADIVERMRRRMEDIEAWEDDGITSVLYDELWVLRHWLIGPSNKRLTNV